MKKFILLIIVVSFTCQLALATGFNYKIVESVKYVKKDVEGEKKEAFENNLEFDMKYSSFRAYVEYQFYQPKEVMFGAGAGKDRNSIEKYYIEYKNKRVLTRFGTLNPVFNRGVILDAIIDEDFDKDNTLIGGYLRYRGYGFMVELVGGNPKKEDVTSTHETGFTFGTNVNYKISKMFKPGLTYFYNEYTLDEEDMTNSIIGFNTTFSFDNFDLYTEYAMQLEDRDEDEAALFSSLSYYFGNISGIVEYKQYKNFAYHFNNPPTANYPGEDLEDTQEPGKDEIGFQAEINYGIGSSSAIKLNYSECWNEDKDLEQSIIYSEYYGKLDHTFFKFELQKVESNNTTGAGVWENEWKPGAKVSFPVYEDLSAELIHYYTIKEYSYKVDHYEPELTIGFGYKFINISTRIMRESYDEENIDYSVWPPARKIDEKVDYWIGTEIIMDLEIYGKITAFIGKEKGGKICRNGVCKDMNDFDGFKVEYKIQF